MTKSIIAGLCVLLLGLGYCLAQDKPAYNEVGQTYMADTGTYSRGIDSATAMRLLQQPLLSSDSMGVLRQVSTYTFTYASRGVFSDADGRPFIGVDYFSTQSEKGVLPHVWLDILPSKLKPGDTIIIDQPKTFTTDKQHPEYNGPTLKMYVK